METNALIQAYQNRDTEAIESIISSNEPKEAVYEELTSFLKEALVDLEKKLRTLVYNPDGEEAENFKGLSFLHHNFDIKTLNALPAEFEDIRDQITHTISLAGGDMTDTKLPLSIALLKYADKIEIKNEKIRKQIYVLLRKKNYLKQENLNSAKRTKLNKQVKTYFSIGFALIALIALGFKLNRIYQKKQANEAFTEAFTKPIESKPKESSREHNKSENWYKSERLLAAGFHFGDEFAAELKKRDNVEAELKNLDFFFGNNPIQCYQSSIFNGIRPTKSIVIHGDKTHDAILFLFWGNRVGRQVYIPKKSNFYVFINKNEQLTAAVIYGNKWDKNLDNPCGGKGFFSEDVIYAPEHSHATIPRDLNTRNKNVRLRLRHKKLLPTEEADAELFLKILKDFAD